ncbi:hypothetical protein N657DRAFT_629310 [Parathielavia appendiculata]|uniref:Uncharacterized protein n=1 Tax=Parathielavia appendiculata TaxID=2587402 RepID=A0AAN6U8E5_9PEZI|nr:hypothetical protein N657DRAFT_629310 [Parathielavia appendiculata]
MARMDEFRRRHMHDDDDENCELDDENFEVGAATQGAQETEPQSASPEEVEPMGPVQETSVSQMPTVTPAIADHTPLSHGQAAPVFDFNLERVAQVSRSVARADIPTNRESPRLNVEAAMAAIAGIRGPGAQPQHVPSDEQLIARPSQRESAPGSQAEGIAGALGESVWPEQGGGRGGEATAEQANAALTQHAGPAERKVLPARGVRGNKEAKQKALQGLLKEEGTDP